MNERIDERCDHVLVYEHDYLYRGWWIILCTICGFRIDGEVELIRFFDGIKSELQALRKVAEAAKEWYNAETAPDGADAESRLIDALEEWESNR